MPIASPAMVPEMLVGISYARVEYSTSAQNTIVAFHPGVFQSIVIFYGEAIRLRIGVNR